MYFNFRLLILLLVFTFEVSGQSWKYYDSSFSIAWTIAEWNSDIIVSSVYTDRSIIPDIKVFRNKPVLLKVNNKGEKIISKKVVIEDTSILISFLKPIIPINKDSLQAFALGINKMDSTPFLISLIFNKELDIVYYSKSKIVIPIKYFSPSYVTHFNLKKRIDGSYYGSASFCFVKYSLVDSSINYNAYSLPAVNYFFKTTMLGNIINQTFLPFNFSNRADYFYEETQIDITYDVLNNHYISASVSDGVFVFDDSLKLLNNKSFSFLGNETTVFGENNILKVNDKYMIAGIAVLDSSDMRHFPHNYTQIKRNYFAFYQFKSNGEISGIKYIKLPNEADSASVTEVFNDTNVNTTSYVQLENAIIKNCDALNENIIFCCYQNSSGQIIVFQLDSNLTIKWTKVLNMGVSHLYSINASSDGGCFISCWAFPDFTVSADLPACVIKLDAKGKLASSHQVWLEAKSNYLYPNPVNGSFFISNTTHQILNVTVYNLQGQLLIQQKLYSENEPVNVQQLEAGMYVYTLTNNNLQIGSGKFIKQ